ncbi:MAG: hypothetical protein WKG01_34890 [Kofleriaceae bacterium]
MRTWTECVIAWAGRASAHASGTTAADHRRALAQLREPSLIRCPPEADLVRLIHRGMTRSFAALEVRPARSATVVLPHARTAATEVIETPDHPFEARILCRLVA